MVKKLPSMTNSQVETHPTCTKLSDRDLPGVCEAGFNNQENQKTRTGKNSRGHPDSARLRPKNSGSVSESDLGPGLVCGSRG